MSRTEKYPGGRVRQRRGASDIPQPPSTVCYVITVRTSPVITPKTLVKCAAVTIIISQPIGAPRAFPRNVARCAAVCSVN